MLPRGLFVHLFRCSVAEMSAYEASLAGRLTDAMIHQRGHRPAASEIRSWERSLPVLRADLMDAGLGSVEVLIEYQLPLTSKRVDVVLAGHHPASGNPSYVVVELKQWSSAQRAEDSDALVEVEGYGRRAVLHPGVQAEGYREHLQDFLVALPEAKVTLDAVAYLHNATDLSVADVLRSPVHAKAARVFTGQRRATFLEYLRGQLSVESDGAASADLLLGSKVAPSRKLLDVAAAEVKDREQFVLLGEQREAYELVRRAVARARRSDRKTAVIVSGGPGTGKSVIALSLLGELAREGRTVLHATGSRSFTQTLRKVAGRRAPAVQKLFQYFNSFMSAEPNDLDCLILDEAHRIRATSESRWTKREHRTGRPQISELLDAARVPVFLLDQHQVVRPGEQGTSEDIAAHARAKGLEVEHVSLDAQYRCGGSEQYVMWVQRLLGLVPGGPVAWDNGADDFTVRIADTPAELEHHVRARDGDGYTARMAAGYCWPWSDPRADGSLVPDVRIGDWARPWNLRGERAVGGAPPSALWATDPAGVDQVGCIYTAQGFEYDHAGVIIGPDLVWRNGWKTVRSASRDPDFRSTKKVDDAEVDRLIRNVYKVLLTRGMRSVTIYSPDEQTRSILRNLAPSG